MVTMLMVFHIMMLVNRERFKENGDRHYELYNLAGQRRACNAFS